MGIGKVDIKKLASFELLFLACFEARHVEWCQAIGKPVLSMVSSLACWFGDSHAGERPGLRLDDLENVLPGQLL
jgi:hypothetical protein